MFEHKVRSMMPGQFIEAMIFVIQNPYTKLTTESYGRLTEEGQEASIDTNVIIHLNGGKIFPDSSISSRKLRADFLDCDEDFLEKIEEAIGFLQFGTIIGFSETLRELGIRPIFKELEQILEDFQLPQINLLEEESELRFKLTEFGNVIDILKDFRL